MRKSIFLKKRGNAISKTMSEFMLFNGWLSLNPKYYMHVLVWFANIDANNQTL